MSPHVLILGGTTEARRLAAALAARPGTRVTTSLAGRVTRPGALDGEVRVGGFGGPDGLAAWLREESVDAVVDATHPFAATITANAATATAAARVPLLVLRRPGWQPGPGDRWHPAPSLEAAAALLPGLGRRVFLTTGRLGLAAFAGLAELSFVVRSVEPPLPPLPPHTDVLLARGPFTVADETAPAARAARRRAGHEGQRRRGDLREAHRRPRPRPPRRGRPPPAPAAGDHRAPGRAGGTGAAGRNPRPA